MKKEEKLLSLIHKRLTGELKGTDTNQLDAFLENADNQLIADQVEKVWKNTGDYKKGYQPNVEAGLSKFKSQIQQTQVPENKVVQLGRRSWLKYVAAAAILIVGSFMVWNNLNVPTESIATIENTEEVRLADNTEVSINRGSHFNYPNSFSDNERKVELKGEAFFDVAKNPEKPFIIQTGNLQVRVLGTSFNIRNYDNEDLAEVTVKSGKVEVSTLNGSQKWILEANDQLTLNKKDKKINLEENVKNLNALAWSTKELSFKNEKLQKVKEAIEHTYNVEIEISERALLECGYTIHQTLKNESLENVLEALKVSFQMESVKKVDKKYILQGGICNN